MQPASKIGCICARPPRRLCPRLTSGGIVQKSTKLDMRTHNTAVLKVELVLIPQGVGPGAAGAGAVVGAAGRAVASPVGAAYSVVIRGVAGGLAGRGIAESIDRTVEDIPP
jgi:hypothetical protein